MAENVIRTLTEEEKKEMVDLKNPKKTPMNVFLARLAEREQEIKRDFVPICTKCAINEFEELMAKEQLEANRKMVARKPFEFTNGKNIDFDKFVGDQHFKFEGDEKIVRDIRMRGGIKEKEITYKRTYVCREYGYKVTFMIAEDLYEELKDKEKGKAKGKISE